MTSRAPRFRKENPAQAAEDFGHSNPGEDVTIPNAPPKDA